MKLRIVLIAIGILSVAGIAWTVGQLRNQEVQAGLSRVVSVTDEHTAVAAPDNSADPSTAHEATSPPVKSSRHRQPEPSSPAAEEWLSGFELIERSGKTVRSEELKGQPYVVGFFFTLCPSICVNQNAKVKELQEKYRGQPLRLLSISCDPEVDRPEVLREYAERFDADPEQWLFLTGKLNYITRVAAEMYFLAAERRFHAEKFVLVDAQGNNVGFYTWSDPLQFNQLERDIDQLLATQPAVE